VPLTAEHGETYGSVLKYLNSEAGKPIDNRLLAGMDLVQAQMRGYGATVIELPGMFLLSDTGAPVGVQQRSFPRNIANGQPTVRNSVIVATPPREGKDPRKRESIFLRAWKRTIPGVVGEDEFTMKRAWTNGGEAHCSSNVIREPIQK